MAEELLTRYRGMPCCLLVEFRGLKGVQSADLRMHLREAKLRMNVVKSSVASRVFQSSGFDGLKDLLRGQSALVYGVDDPVLLVKRVLEWNKKHRVLSISGGFAFGRLLEREEIHVLSTLPSREVLLGWIAGAMAAPLSRLAGGMNTLLVNLLYALKNLSKACEESSA